MNVNPKPNLGVPRLTRLQHTELSSKSRSSAAFAHVCVYTCVEVHIRVHTGVRAREARLGAKYCTHDT